MSLSTGTNWLFNFIVAFVTPPLFDVIGAGYYFLLVGFSLLSFLVVWFVYPETANCTLEELGAVFGDKVMEDEKDIRTVAAITAEAVQKERTGMMIEDPSSSEETLQQTAIVRALQVAP